MRQCPYCAEEIQSDAILCRYCHGDLREYESFEAGRRAEEERRQRSLREEEERRSAKEKGLILHKGLYKPKKGLYAKRALIVALVLLVLGISVTGVVYARKVDDANRRFDAAQVIENRIISKYGMLTLPIVGSKSSFAEFPTPSETESHTFQKVVLNTPGAVVTGNTPYQDLYRQALVTYKQVEAIPGVSILFPTIRRNLDFLRQRIDVRFPSKVFYYQREGSTSKVIVYVEWEVGKFLHTYRPIINPQNTQYVALDAPSESDDRGLLEVLRNLVEKGAEKGLDKAAEYSFEAVDEVSGWIRTLEERLNDK